jgi:peptidoglycan/LPS O-acetylase OafA/YrhL
MYHRILLYFIYSFLLIGVGFLLFYQFSSNNKEVYFLLISFGFQYLISIILLKIISWMRVLVTLGIWILSFIVGMLVLLHYAFNEKPDPADLYGLIAFLLMMFICYEVYFLLRKRFSKANAIEN